MRSSTPPAASSALAALPSRVGGARRARADDGAGGGRVPSAGPARTRLRPARSGPLRAAGEPLHPRAEVRRLDVPVLLQVGSRDETTPPGAMKSARRSPRRPCASTKPATSSPTSARRSRPSSPSSSPSSTGRRTQANRVPHHRDHRRRRRHRTRGSARFAARDWTLCAPTSTRSPRRAGAELGERHIYARWT